MCHVSTKESVALIRAAKAEGLPVSAETAPHYLLLCEDDMQDDGRFKMNPPLRGADDRAALLSAALDGTIDCVATDHAPHSAAEKSGGLWDSAMGVVGLETAFAALYTGLVETGRMPLARLIELMSLGPRRLFPCLGGGEITPGGTADFTVADMRETYTIEPEAFQSMGRATPFAGMPVRGKIIMTVAGGKTVWQR
jgi:dihydroorotase